MEQVLAVQLVPFDSTRKLLISRDITQLDRVQTVHRDFVANVSHELRTPLTVIGGFLKPWPIWTPLNRTSPASFCR